MVPMVSHEKLYTTREESWNVGASTTIDCLLFRAGSQVGGRKWMEEQSAKLLFALACIRYGKNLRRIAPWRGAEDGLESS